ncbi:MAG: TetR/AcrR family transcriptional regulator [Gaiellaceae bacterium]
MPKVVDHEERRAEVAAAVWRAISQYGVEGTTIRLIAKEAGYSTGVLSHYFDGKDELLMYALREAMSHTIERMLDHAERKPAAAALRAVVREALPLDEERRTEWLVWLAFWSRATTDERLRKEQIERYEAYRGGIRTLIEAGQEDGSLRRDVDAEEAAEDLVCQIDGMALQAVFDPHRLTARKQTRRIDRHLDRLRT